MLASATSQTQNTLYIQHKKSGIIMINVMQECFLREKTESSATGTVLIQKNYTCLKLCVYS